MDSRLKLSRYQAQEERRRMLFEEAVGPGCQSKAVRHTHVAVLLLSWHESQDDLRVAPEVNALQQVFEDEYHFKVVKKHFRQDPGVNLELQAQKYITDFAFEESSEDSLLIVYYAGHGYVSDEVQGNDLALKGQAKPPDGPTVQQQQRDDILWSSAELGITKSHGDVLLIFDCCYAGRLVGVRGHAYRHFEFLGSCEAHQKAKSAGPESFTTALIWALRYLAAKNEAFNTYNLRRTIKLHETFSQIRNQEPVLSYRHHPSGHITIDKRGLPPPDMDSIARTPSVVETQAAERHQGYIDVRIHYERPIEDDVIDSTVECLKILKRKTELQIDRIEYQGGEPSPRAKLACVVTELIQRGRATSAAAAIQQSECLHGVSPLPPGLHPDMTLGSREPEQLSTGTTPRASGQLSAELLDMPQLEHPIEHTGRTSPAAGVAAVNSIFFHVKAILSLIKSTVIGKRDKLGPVRETMYHRKS